MVSQAASLSEQAYLGPTSVSPYFFNYDLGKELDVDDQHPLKRKGKRNLRQVAGDLIPPDHFLSVIFYSELMTEFLGQSLGRESLPKSRQIPVSEYKLCRMKVVASSGILMRAIW